MGFGKSNEVSEGSSRKFYTGVENFKVTAVNPSKAEIEDIYGREINYEPEYLGTQNVQDSDGEREVDQIKIDFFLSNEDVDNPISTKATFYVAKTHHKSQTEKIKVINDFGKTAWVSEDHARSKTTPENMSWYNVSGMKVAKRGEEELVDFIANLLNLPWDANKVSDPSEMHAKFETEHWEQMFKGDFSYLQSIIDGTNNKVGLALGVKVADDQTMRQEVYRKKSLRQFTMHSSKPTKFLYLDKSITETKANGGYGTTDFGPDDYTLREYSITPTSLDSSNAPEQTDIFASSTASSNDSDDSWM